MKRQTVGQVMQRANNWHTLAALPIHVSSQNLIIILSTRNFSRHKKLGAHTTFPKPRENLVACAGGWTDAGLALTYKTGYIKRYMESKN